MFVWCTILFILGVLAFVDSMFNMGEIFRKVNSVFFMLISIGLLVRTATKMKIQEHENLRDQLFKLKQQVKILQDGEKKLKEF